MRLVLSTVITLAALAYAYLVPGAESYALAPFILPLAAGALGAGIKAIPNAAEIENNKRLRELRGLKEDGMFGLSASERADLGGALFDPVSNQAAQTQAQNEQFLAAQGDGANTAAAIQGLTEGTQRVLGGAAESAAYQIEDLDRQRAAEQEQELQNRIDYKANDQEQIRKQLLNDISGVASEAGEAMGGEIGFEMGTKVPQSSVSDQLRNANVANALQADALAELLATPEGQAQIMQIINMVGGR